MLRTRITFKEHQSKQNNLDLYKKATLFVYIRHCTVRCNRILYAGLVQGTRRAHCRELQPRKRGVEFLPHDAIRTLIN